MQETYSSLISILPACIIVQSKPVISTPRQSQLQFYFGTSRFKIEMPAKLSIEIQATALAVQAMYLRDATHSASDYKAPKSKQFDQQTGRMLVRGWRAWVGWYEWVGQRAWVGWCSA